MSHFELQFILNGGPFVVLMVRYAASFLTAPGRLKFAAYLLAMFSINALLMLDRYPTGEALWRASAVAGVYGLCVVGLGTYVAWRERTQRCH